MNLKASVQTYLNNYVTAHTHMPGGTACCIQNGAVSIGSFGSLEPPGGLGGTPASDTLYEIGSVTKTFTGACLAWLSEDLKLLNLNDAVSSRIPSLANGGVTLPVWTGTLPPLGTSQIQFVQLADFTPGYPNDGTGGLKAPNNWAQLAQYLSGSYAKLQYAPGSTYTYVDAAFELLGSCLAYIQSKNANPNAPTFEYAGLLKTFLSAASPAMSMPDTVIDLDRGQESRMAPGYNSRGFVEPVMGDWRIKSTIADMSVWLQAQMGLVNNGLINSFWKAIFSVSFSDATRQTGLGWDIKSIGNATRYSKNGETSGYSSYIAFTVQNGQPASTGNGVVLLTNYREAQATMMGNDILGLLT